MGCGTSNPKNGELSKSSKTLKAALLIQRWYRRYLARLEARKRYTWSIFQSLEYAGESDQLRLYTFFNDMTAHMQLPGNTEDSASSLISAISSPQRPSSRMDSIEEEDAELLKLTDPNDIAIAPTYKGPHIKLPITTNQLESLVEAFKKKQLLHAKYILMILHECRKILKHLPIINQASTLAAKQITICGDLHGKLEDLFMIFYKNGLPSADNPYIFNGDFVDRGHHSIEIAVLLFSFLIINPKEVYINRGNHEDHIMNLRYGFMKEILSKYRGYASKVVRLFEDVFSWLPLATVIDQKVLVTHGGISDKTDLEYLATIDRHKYLSALRPPVNEFDEQPVDLMEWRQVLDVLWSDPRPQSGCQANTFRGGGSYFGPDVTADILRKHKMKLLIRSHECKPEGYEYTHNDQVLTVFSASNYYEIGSNKGAYVKMTPELKPRIVQFIVTKKKPRKMTLKQRVSLVEESAIRSLKEKIYACKTVLLDDFQKYDPPNIGLIKLNEWCQSMSDVLEMELPWRSLRPMLVKCQSSGLIEYHSTFEAFKIENKFGDGSSVTETLYRNKDNLETMFRAIDKDNSGSISMEEFEEACHLLGQHTNTLLSKEQIQVMARNMDMNKDGYIDFNEFLEAFRIVDKFGQDLMRRRNSTDDVIANGDEK